MDSKTTPNTLQITARVHKYPQPLLLLDKEQQQARIQHFYDLTQLRWDSVTIDSLGTIAGATVNRAVIPLAERRSYTRKLLRKILNEFDDPSLVPQAHNQLAFPDSSVFVAGPYALSWSVDGKLTLHRQGAFYFQALVLDDEALIRASTLSLPQPGTLTTKRSSHMPCTPPPGVSCPGPTQTSKSISISHVRWTTVRAIFQKEGGALEGRVLAKGVASGVPGTSGVVGKPVGRYYTVEYMQWDDPSIPAMLNLDAVNGNRVPQPHCAPVPGRYELLCTQDAAAHATLATRISQYHTYSLASGRPTAVQ